MEICNEKPYKQRFKGVENFLRRVAFNLGNTPSQTEVKIISCIPIDVTDLQQKIVNLEKQLHEAQQLEAQMEESCPGSPVGKDEKKKNTDVKEEKPVPTTIVNTAFVKRSSPVSYSSKKPVENSRTQQVSSYCVDFSSRPSKSTVSFVFPASSGPVRPLGCSRNRYNNEDNGEFERRLGNDLCKSIFRRRKKKKAIGSKSNIKTQFIYYAQESPKSPFHLKDKALLRNHILNNEKDLLSQSYLDSVVRRQYDPKNILEEFSDTSHFSKPICRDIEDNPKYPGFYESDACSCCHGKFQNLDNFMTNGFSVDPMRPYSYNQNERDKTYYDSNLYDMVPVKENSPKFLKPDALHKNDYKRQLDMKNWQEKYRNRYRYDSFVVNYHTKVPIRRFTNKKHVKQTRVKRDQGIKSEKRDGVETSKNNYIECSDIYRKTGTPGTKLKKSEPTRTILLRNEFVETENNAITQGYNQSTQSKSFPTEENKTELTLNQIKSILQSVLQEVKTNSNVNTVPEIPKKDAVIQKGSSQNNMSGNSTLLQSFTYNNSLNTNPCLPSCSHKMPPGQYCFPGMPYQPMKCLQNFPILIHPSTGSPMCACYYRHSSHKSSYNKQATTSTNTDIDIQKSSSKETEKLIKDIYKSMAVSMDYPTKEYSSSDYSDIKSPEINSINVSNKEEKSTEAEILQKHDIETKLSPLELNPNENKFVYTTASSQFNNNRLISNLPFGYTTTRNNNFDERNFKGEEIQRTDSIDKVEVDTDESSDETESDQTIVYDEQTKQEKKGLFKRMLNTVKLFKKRKEVERRKSESDDEQSEDSDSDDYQTVHSRRTVKETPKEEPRPNRRNTDQKKKTKRSPYLEQEYRRHWNEKLMFHGQQQRCSSERPYSRPTTSQSNVQPLYRRNYEARRVSVERNVPSDIMIHQSVKQKIENGTSSPKNITKNDHSMGKLAWIKKHNLGIHCGEQWKKFILEN